MIITFKKFILKLINSLGFSVVNNRNLVNHKGILTVTNSGLNLITSPNDMVVGHSIRTRGYWEIEEVKRLKLYCKKMKISAFDNLLVVGGHVGSIALEFADDFKSIDVIEANPKNFHLLDLNIKINDKKNIFPHNFLASDEISEKSFLLHPTNTGGSKLMPIVKDFDYFKDKPLPLSTKGVVLDNFFQKKFKVMIMDIEGSEIYALRGAQKILSNVNILQVEFSPIHIRDTTGLNSDHYCDLIFPHFKKIYIPTYDKEYEVEESRNVLKEMFENNISTSGLLFSN